MAQRRWEWHPRGWFILLTIGGHSWGFGFMVCKRNGPDFYFGPIILSIQPPMPAWMAKEIEAADVCERAGRADR
jgi:hypothetical protein